jgi:hypothetical protein
MDEGTASYTMDRDFMRIKMAKWGLLFTREEVERARRKERSVRRNNPKFMEKKKKTITPELYR